jgi:hypothetical protein
VDDVRGQQLGEEGGQDVGEEDGGFGEGGADEEVLGGGEKEYVEDVVYQACLSGRAGVSYLGSGFALAVYWVRGTGGPKTARSK